MKLDYKWLAMFVVLVLVFILGRFSARVEDVSTRATSDLADSQSRVSTTEDPRSQKARRARGVRAARSSMNQRAQELERILVGFCDMYNLDDPFSDVMTTTVADKARIYAWIMQTPKNGFPAVMELLERTKDGNGMSSGVLDTLLARWVELDPEAAIQWTQNEKGLLHFQDNESIPIHLAKLAIAYHPDWAVKQLKAATDIRIEKYKAGEYSDDPFGGESLNLELDLFYQRLAILYPSRREEFKEILGDKLLEYGANGWFKGLARSMGNDALLELASRTKDPDTGLIDSNVLDVVARRDWKRAQRWLEKTEGDYNLDSVVWQQAKKADFDQASEWYLSRADGIEDRAERIDDVLRNIDDIQDRVNWLRQMGEAGEPVQKSWQGAVDSMIRMGELQNALGHLQNIEDVKSRQGLQTEIYKKASNEKRIWIKGSPNIVFYTPYDAFTEFHENNPAYRDFVLGANREALERIIAFEESTKQQLGGE